MKKEISVSIVTCKRDGIDLLNKLLDSLCDSYLKLEIYVIDNSHIGNIEKICKDRGITYLFNNKNLGYGAAHNIGIKRAIKHSRYHLVVNPDIFFEGDTLAKLYNFMESEPDIGLIMPRIVNLDGSIAYLCRLLPGPDYLFLRRFFAGLKISKPLLEKMDNIYGLRFTGYNKIMDVPCLSGCFMFIRSEVFEKVGVFDERFFIYLEDYDLSRRIHKSYRTVYYPDASVYHAHKKSSYKDFKFLWYHIVSAVKYFNKWGWFFDKERKLVNKATLKKLNTK